MLKTPLKDILTGAVKEIPNHYLYSIAFERLMLYIGKSASPVKRVFNHVNGVLQLHGLGQLIFCNLPVSLTWRVCFYSLTDCRKTVIEHFRTSLSARELNNYRDWFQRIATLDITALQRLDYRKGERLDYAVSDAEVAMISKYKPCLNVASNHERTPFPQTVNDPASFYRLYPHPEAARKVLARMLGKSRRVQ